MNVRTQVPAVVAAVLWIGGTCSCRNAPSATNTSTASLAPAEAAQAEAAQEEPASPAAPAKPGVFELPGTATPVRTSKLSAKGSGILKSVLVREGERAKAGAVLCALDAIDIEIRAEGAKVAAEQAAEGYRSAKSEYDRNQQLFKAGVLTGSTWEKVETGLRMAELAQKQAQVGLRMAEQALYDSKLRAPFSGVVTKVLAEEGLYITSMPPTVIIVLVDTDILEVRVPVPERKLSLVKSGAPVEVILPAANATRTAKVNRIAEVVDPMTRSAEAIIRLDNRDHALPAGIYARVRFTGIPDDGAAAAEDPGQPPASPETAGR